ncbi:hypothetical protein ABLI39_16345 [Pseudarthrobacter sp. B907]|uniref:hypothetical protein n=1 Tax=Pseudarthrobacter sp. B907 TaxID=3158261 RepID=UPI0032DBA421
MPSLSGSGPLWALQILPVALLVMAAAAGSVYLARKHQASDGGLPDAVFWDGFAGLAIIAPAVLLPSLASPPTGLLLTALAVAAAALSYRLTPHLFRWREVRRAARDASAADAAAAERHREALERWRRYELDPAFCIDFPAMSDPRRPETSAMLKAMKAAEQQRTWAGRGPASGGYSSAVDRLERALAKAERAAGARHDSTELHISSEGAR